MKYISLSRGKRATVCDCHYDLVKDYKWHCLKAGYAARTLWDPEKQRTGKMIYMHRVIAGAEGRANVDHINGKKRDNRCKNLRLASQRQNCMNRGIDKRNSSGYKGVSWDKQKRKWRVSLVKEGQQYHGGYYKDKREAALAYNRLAIKHYQEFAWLNQIS